eukprot:12620907-Alexandrium_andersonii.AAC.1
MPWSTDESYGALMTVDGSGPYIGDICHVTQCRNLASRAHRADFGCDDAADESLPPVRRLV